MVSGQLMLGKTPLRAVRLLSVEPCFRPAFYLSLCLSPSTLLLSRDLDGPGG
jgi:hypothetical protein